MLHTTYLARAGARAASQCTTTPVLPSEQQAVATSRSVPPDCVRSQSVGSNSLGSARFRPSSPVARVLCGVSPGLDPPVGALRYTGFGASRPAKRHQRLSPHPEILEKCHEQSDSLPPMRLAPVGAPDWSEMQRPTPHRHQPHPVPKTARWKDPRKCARRWPRRFGHPRTQRPICWPGLRGLGPGRGPWKPRPQSQPLKKKLGTP